MKTRKYFLAAAALVLVVGLCFGAMAQSKARGSFAKLPSPEPVMNSVSVNAIEVSDGIVVFNTESKLGTAFGYSFLGRTKGAFPGSFNLSMNCTPARPVPGGETAMTGGSWTLPVYMMGIKGTGGYAGALYGTIAKGTMVFDKTGTNANVYFVLNVDGGTHSWAGFRGYATFSGTLSVDKETQTTLSGDLVFSILPTK